MVMGDDSCLRGCVFESRCHIPDGHFFTLICVKIYCLFEKTKSKRKRDRDWPIF